jgi:hypothetical protein
LQGSKRGDYSAERPVVQQITIRDSQGHTENRTILNGKLLA